MNNILKQYVRFILEKNELLTEPDEISGREENAEDEMSVVANIAGVSTPLGSDSTYPKKKKKNKKRTPAQSAAAAFAAADLAFKK